MAASAAHAATTADCTVVTGPELKRQSGRLATMDATQLQLTSVDGRQGVDLPLDSVAWIEFNAPPPPNNPNGQLVPLPRPSRRPPVAEPAVRNSGTAGEFLLVLRDGERLRGTPGAIGNDTLTWHARALGDRSIGVAQIAGWGRVANANEIEALTTTLNRSTLSRSSSETTAPTQDELRLTNGDVVSGVIASADAKTVTVQSSDGGTVPIDWTNVRQVRLALLPGTEAPAAPSGAKAPAFVVRTNGGELIRCASVTLGTDGRLAMKPADGGSDGAVAIGELVSIEHLNGAVRSLAGVAPASRTYVPYFPPASSTASGESNFPATATIGSQTTRAFVMARPKSRITWKLDELAPHAKHFRTRYGIPDARRYANAIVRVYLDDRVVHEHAGVTSGVLSDAIDVELGDAKTLTLEVDYGDAFDVQDDVIWFEPVLVRD